MNGPGPNLLSLRVRSIGTSPTIAMSQRAAAMRADGVDVISMAVGEPDFDTPAHIVEAAYTAAKRGFTRYTAADGAPVVKLAVERKLVRDNDLRYAPSEIHVASGDLVVSLLQLLEQPAIGRGLVDFGFNSRLLSPQIGGPTQKMRFF